MVLEKTLESPLKSKEIILSILKESNPEYSLEGLMLKQNPNTLATWCKELTHWKVLMMGKIKGKRRRGQQKMRWLDGITNSMDMSLSKLLKTVKDSLACYSPWDHKELDTTQRLDSNNNNSLVTSCTLTNLFELPGPYLKIRTFSPASVDFVGIKWHHLC